MKNSTARRALELRDALENDIVNGRLQPGTRLDEMSLAERFQVSRTPIREAFQHLSAAGLVEILPKRGAFVTRIGLPQLVEMFEVMAELEAMCGRLAARRISEAESAELLAAHESCRKAAERGDADAYYYDNERFHNVIYQASRNRFLAQQTRQLHARLKPYRRLQLRVRNRVARSLAEHQGIVDAILAGDEALAESCIKQHILIQGERFADFVASVSTVSTTATGDELHLSP